METRRLCVRTYSKGTWLLFLLFSFGLSPTVLVFVFTGSGSKNSTEEQGTKPYPHFPEHVQITWWFSLHIDVANRKTLVFAIGDHPLSGDGIFPKQFFPSTLLWCWRTGTVGGIGGSVSSGRATRRHT